MAELLVRDGHAQSLDAVTVEIASRLQRGAVQQSLEACRRRAATNHVDALRVTAATSRRASPRAVTADVDSTQAGALIRRVVEFESTLALRVRAVPDLPDIVAVALAPTRTSRARAHSTEEPRCGPSAAFRREPSSSVTDEPSRRDRGGSDRRGAGAQACAPERQSRAGPPGRTRRCCRVRRGRRPRGTSWLACPAIRKQTGTRRVVAHADASDRNQSCATVDGKSRIRSAGVTRGNSVAARQEGIRGSDALLLSRSKLASNRSSAAYGLEQARSPRAH